MNLPERPRAIILSKVNEIVCNRLRPVISTSRDGKPDSFSIWNDRYKSKHALKSWTEYARQSKDILIDIEDCINEDMKRFVGLSGYDIDNDLDRFYMIYKPHSTQNNTSGMD